jgi:hypothetical protein
MNQGAASQATFSLCSFFSQQVAFEGLEPLNLSVPTNLECFLGTGMCLYFGHLTSNLVCKGMKIIQ